VNVICGGVEFAPQLRDPKKTEPLMAEFLNRLLNGAIGAGLILVFLPSIGLFFGVEWLTGAPLIGLPVLAVFGVMILFGALALTASLFSKLNLSDRTQALALPEGSIRAAIALSLIVLFAIIAILLHQQAATPYVVPSLDEAEKQNLVQQNAQRVLAVVPRCMQGGPTCDVAHRVYDIHLLPAPTPESTDIAKQLLILIGTLVTSVVSFYFGSRSSEPQSGAGSSTAYSANHGAAVLNQDAAHGAIRNVTLDHELPVATGGVES
jgi:hypothetical protein